MGTREYYTAAITKALELKGLIYPAKGDRLGFMFPNKVAQKTFFSWFSELKPIECVSKGWFCPLGTGEVIISFNEFSFKT